MNQYKLTEKELKILEQVKAGTMSKSEAARKLGKNREQVSRWLERADRDGLWDKPTETVDEQPRKPIRTLKKVTETVVEQPTETVVEQPTETVVEQPKPVLPEDAASYWDGPGEMAEICGVDESTVSRFLSDTGVKCTDATYSLKYKETNLVSQLTKLETPIEVVDEQMEVAVMSKGSEKTMTTRELAEQLGCEVKTIMNNAKRYLPNKVIEHGKPTMWTEQEAQILLECMKGNQSNQTDLCSQLHRLETPIAPAVQAANVAKSYADITRNMSVEDTLKAVHLMHNTEMSIMELKLTEVNTENIQLKERVKDLEENRTCFDIAIPGDGYPFDKYRHQLRDLCNYGLLELDDLRELPDKRKRIEFKDGNTMNVPYAEYEFKASKKNRQTILRTLAGLHPRTPIEELERRVPEKHFF